ncbi:PREDICTED: RNA polymerase II degradation factor 1 [Drosophila arizonae]|uniref:RNA polymerase II degradation factor 1 n=1 Tax=Drosophila arizonae TaxID=7263 RepID=A0ABM1NPX5_DROAR|nr:PREDICTED: RNA polymerase II degradation factor 1 [Drosophila arizonae]
MQNLIKSRAVFEILKKPLPELLRFYRDSESDSDCEESSTDVATAAPETTAAAEITAAAAAAAAAEAEAAAKLNVNASVFVPRSKDTGDSRLVDVKRHFEAMDVRKPVGEPKLLLPWKGFPKPQNVERTVRPRTYPQAKLATPVIQSEIPAAQHKELKTAVINETESKAEEARPPTALVEKESTCAPLACSLPSNRKKPLKDRALIKQSLSDDKRREQERKVALEALKLVEQRRMREPTEQPEVIVHLTRAPVEFTPEERVRVDRLRIIKREHIENVLREMRDERELKQQKAQGVPITSRYICLKRSTQSNAQPEPQQPQQPLQAKQPQQQPQQQPQLQPQQQPQQPPLPRRYIPTVKQWDERCKAKAHEAAAGANKENNTLAKDGSRFEEHANPQRAMGPSSQGNIMPSKAAPQSGSAAKDRELFVPRYWPPAPMVAKGETRRGNLTHARNITRAFANCGLLPTPSAAWEQENVKQEYESLPSATQKSVKRYGMEQLLKLEPQPHKLEKPIIAERLAKLGFMCE